MSYEQYGTGYTTGRQEVGISAGTAFKIGFFGAFGAMVAGLIISVVLFLVSLIIGVGFLQTFQ